MLNRRSIHNSAILKPHFIKCNSQYLTGRHAFAKTDQGYEQCIDCGKIKITNEENNHGLHRHNPSK